MTITPPAVHYDMFDRDIYASPYAAYKRLRDKAPLYYNDEYDFYALSRFDDVSRVLTDRETFISGKGGVYNIIRAGIEMPEGLFIFEDPPQHTMHRALVSRLFTPRAVNGLEPQIRELCADVLDALVGAERFDFMHDLAMQIPIKVIGMLVGLPRADQDALQAIFHKNMHADTAGPSDSALDGIVESAEWFNGYLDWRAEHPTDDVMTQLLNMELEDETGVKRRLRREEILTYLTLITSAGSDTTAMAIGWAAKLLGDHPDQRRELARDPSLLQGAVEEVLRYESVSYSFCRSVATDAEFHGHVVPTDSVLVVLPGAANRDERQFAAPETFDIRREPSQHLTFSFGPHFCLGASLARLEMRVVLEEVLERFPEWTVDHDNAELTKGIDTRGWERLPVSVRSS
jgi:cytochrome P450